MKKIFLLTLISLALVSTFFIPASALSMEDIESDPNYEVYVETETVTMDIVIDTDHDYCEFELPYNDIDVLKYEFEITNYEGMISIWFLEFYDYMGENSCSYTSGDAIVVPRTSCGVRMELYSDEPLDDVVIEFRTYRYRLSAEFSSASNAYWEGYEKGRAYEAEIAKGQISDAYTQGGIDRSNDIAAHLSTELSGYVDAVPDIKPGFNSWVSFSSQYLAALANHYETVEIPKAYQSGYDDGADGAALEGEPAGSYQLGYDRGYQIGKTEAFDSAAIVDSIDKLAERGSLTLFDILKTEILGYTLIEFLSSIVLVLIVLICIPIFKSVL